MMVELHATGAVHFDHPSDHTSSVLLHRIGVIVEVSPKGILLRRGAKGRKTKPKRDSLGEAICDFLEQGPLRFTAKNQSVLLLALATSQCDDPIVEALDPLDEALAEALFASDPDPSPRRAGTVIPYRRRKKT